MLDDVLARLNALPEADRRALHAEVRKATADMPFVPNPGPQTEAYLSRADLLLYGGQGGGGKSALLAGLALSEHYRSLLLRVQYTDLDGMIDEVCKVAGGRRGLNSAPPAKFKSQDGRIVDFGAASNLDRAQTWQGQPHDLIGFDEACQFLEPVVRFLMGWNRAADADLDERSTQRVRTVMASNPPLSAEGQWIVGMFRPWLDPAYGGHAAHGELRWFITDPDGKDMEVDGPDDCREWGGQVYRPKSRTFIPAALSDNPFLVNTGYQATLDALPEPLRSAIRDGNFMAAREDDPWQVVPTEWVLAANERWRQWGEPGRMTALGMDPARGGRDQTVFSPRHGRYFDELVRLPGRETPDGPSAVSQAVKVLRDGALIGVDAIGIGGDSETALRAANLRFESVIGSQASHGMTRDGSFGFYNRRAELWWSLREALDPNYGLGLALPPDPQLQADLTAPKYEVRPGKPAKILIESKEALLKRLGRSPDSGDAVVYAWGVGPVDNTAAATVVPIVQQPRGGYDPLRY
jgi:hypothetical protein